LGRMMFDRKNLAAEFVTFLENVIYDPTKNM